MYWVSPQHITNAPVDKWPLELKIEVFAASIDGWHLQVADRCINGWQVNGQECINSIIDYQNEPANYVPHSGWAVLQIVLGYFETIAFFQCGGVIGIDKHYELFKRGVDSVFPEFIEFTPSLANMLYSDLRGGLYHSGVASGNVILSGVNSAAVAYDPNDRLWKINPHSFVPKLRVHLRLYVETLLNDTNHEERKKFRNAFIVKYLK